MMARSPDMLRTFAGLAREVVGVPGKVPLALKRLLAHMANRATGASIAQRTRPRAQRQSKAYLRR